MIKVIEWQTEDTSDGAHVYRLDEPGEGERFFRDMLNNAETDGSEVINVIEMTPTEWEECVKNGEELA